MLFWKEKEKIGSSHHIGVLDPSTQTLFVVKLSIYVRSEDFREHLLLLLSLSYKVL